MTKPYYNSDYATLTYIKANRLTVLAWKQSATSEEYLNVFTKALKYNRKNKAKLFLTDMRKQGILDPEMVKWTMSDIIPEAIENGLEKIAMVFEDDLFLNVLAETIDRNLADTKVELKLFENPDDALFWLKS